MAAEEQGHELAGCSVGTRGGWDFHRALRGLQRWGLLSHTQKLPCIVMVNLTDAGVDALKTTIIVVVVIHYIFPEIKIKTIQNLSKPFSVFDKKSKTKIDF